MNNLENIIRVYDEKEISNSCFPFPNQDFFWLNNFIEAVHKNVKVDSALFAGGVLYASMYKGLNPQCKVNALDINPYSIIGQAYLVHLINNYSYEESIRYLLIDRFESHNKELVYDKDDFFAARKVFNQFINLHKALADEDASKLFNIIF